MDVSIESCLASFDRLGNPMEFVRLGLSLEQDGDLRHAASAYDRAYGLSPYDEKIATARARVLDALAVTEHGIVFRYIPAGTFLMGSDSGDPDEMPAHPVRLDEYWLSETCISWAKYCELMDWDAPPEGLPKDAEAVFQQLRDDPENRWDHLYYRIYEATKIQRLYSHDAAEPAEEGMDRIGDSYDLKPMVSVEWSFTEPLMTRLSSGEITYCLPTEAEWEKAARGGLIGATYAWGNYSPGQGICDFDRIQEVYILPMRTFPPNGFGLYAMCGSVWEWVSDWYDADFYRESSLHNQTGPQQGEQRVLRGGSWTDCAEAATVSYRMAYSPTGWQTANIGFRLCRKANEVSYER